MPPAANPVHAGRLRAAFAYLATGIFVSLVTGCGSSGPTPLGASLHSLVSGGPDEAAHAANHPHASIAVRSADHRGLLILGAVAGRHTFWPSSQGISVQLQDGGLYAITGVQQDLLDTRYPDPDALPWRQRHPAPYAIERHVREHTGAVVHHVGTATLSCHTTEEVQLPLATLELERCREQIRWKTGEVTRADLWRSTDTGDLWAYSGQAWPGGSSITWQVARPWW